MQRGDQATWAWPPPAAARGPGCWCVVAHLVYRKAARNFNPMAATAGEVAIAEVEELVDVGELDPECVHTPGVFVQRVVVAPRQKRIERRTVRK